MDKKTWQGSIKHQIQRIVGENAKHLSFGARHNLECNLHAFGKYLRERYQNLKLSGLGERHISAYVDSLKRKGNSMRTVINTITHLRFLAKGIGKANIVHRTNAEYGFERSDRAGIVNRSVVLSPEQLDTLAQKHHSFRTAAELQRLFALRLEEAGKFTVHQADRNNYLALAGSWCKNGRPRNVPVTTPEQRAFLDTMKSFKGKNESTAGRDFETMRGWKRGYHSAMKSIGAKSHGLRHSTIQDWYHKGTGYLPPICGGPRIKEMPSQDRESVWAFCFQLTEAIGHSRIDVLTHYLGKL